MCRSESLLLAIRKTHPAPTLSFMFPYPSTSVTKNKLYFLGNSILLQTYYILLIANDRGEKKEKAV
jgi:hypothetical protein